MSATLELENAANWAVKESHFFEVTPENPFLEYLSVETFNSNVIGVLVDNAKALDTWHFAGWLGQVINLPFGPNPAGSAISDRRLWLRRKQLFVFPQFTPTYKISARFPKWFTQASITIWEYQGPQTDTLEIQLIQMQEKLDTLLQKNLPQT